LLSMFFFFCISAGCETSTGTMPLEPSLSAGPKKPDTRSFFDRLSDALTERECSVVRFTCPFGLGPAGEPCYCTDPSGVVLQGRTVK